MLNSQLLLMPNPTQVANSADKSQQAGTLNLSKSHYYLRETRQFT